MPYIYAHAVEASKSGMPVMRPMILEFQDDPACDYLDRQYILGDSLLVAPVFNEDGEVSYYLPTGKWTNFITGQVIEGGRWIIREKHDYLSLPLMVRPNSIIPVGADDSRPDYDYTDNVEFQVFELGDGEAAQREIYDMNSEEKFHISVRRTRNRILVYVADDGKPYTILFRNMNNFKNVDNGRLEITSVGTRIIPDRNVKKISIELN